MKRLPILLGLLLPIYCQAAADFQTGIYRCLNSTGILLNAPKQISVCFEVYVDAAVTNEGTIFITDEAASANYFQIATPTDDTLTITKDAVTTDGVWTAPMTFEQWNKVCVTYDWGDDANDPTVRVNGIAQTVTETSTPNGATTSPSTGYAIGNNSSGTSDFDGALANVLVWNRLLDTVEQDNYVNKPGTALRRPSTSHQFRLWLPFNGPMLASGGGNMSAYNQALVTLPTNNMLVGCTTGGGAGLVGFRPGMRETARPIGLLRHDRVRKH